MNTDTKLCIVSVIHKKFNCNEVPPISNYEKLSLWLEKKLEIDCVGAWDLDELIASNKNLISFDPKRNKEDYIVSLNT